MDPVHLIWLFAVGAVVGGAVIGAIVYRNLAPSKKETESLKQELEQSQQELASYRASVDEHFSKTSGLVNQLTQDYVKVYQHLAEGAQTLGSNPDFGHRLEQHQGKVLISMKENSTAADDSIVSDQAAAGPEPANASRDFSPPPEEAAPAEEAPAVDNEPEKMAAKEPSDEISEPPVDENPEPVINPDIPAPEIDESKVTVKATNPKEPTLLH